MKFSLRPIHLAIMAFTFLVAQVGLADPRTLIEMNGDSPSAGLAKSWSKVKDGEYKFELDTSKTLGGGAAVTPAAVKSSLEGHMSDMGVSVTPQGASAVDVTYSGDEKAFLQKVSQTKIRANDTNVALESSTSEGGIRAKLADRDANPGEVKASVAKINGSVIVAQVNDSKNNKIKKGQIIKIKGAAKDMKKNDKLFFKPEKKDGDTWVPVAGSLIH
jgi:hypothetical protein